MLSLYALLSLATAAHSSPTIALIGDSHSVLSFGSTFAEAVPGTQRYAVSASAAKDWLKPKICATSSSCDLHYGYATPEGNADGTPPPSFPGLKEILRNHQPAAVVIALGTNDASLNCQKAFGPALSDAKRLIQLARGKRCLWIGPPTYTKGPVHENCQANYNRFVDELKKTVAAGRCQFIDSREILNPATNQPMEANDSDQIHFDAELGAFWAKQALEKIGKLP